MIRFQLLNLLVLLFWLDKKFALSNFGSFLLTMFIPLLMYDEKKKLPHSIFQEHLRDDMVDKKLYHPFIGTLMIILGSLLWLFVLFNLYVSVLRFVITKLYMIGLLLRGNESKVKIEIRLLHLYMYLNTSILMFSTIINDFTPTEYLVTILINSGILYGMCILHFMFKILKASYASLLTSYINIMYLTYSYINVYGDPIISPIALADLFISSYSVELTTRMGPSGPSIKYRKGFMDRRAVQYIYVALVIAFLMIRFNLAEPVRDIFDKISEWYKNVILTKMNNY